MCVHPWQRDRGAPVRFARKFTRLGGISGIFTILLSCVVATAICILLRSAELVGISRNFRNFRNFSNFSTCQQKLRFLAWSFLFRFRSLVRGDRTHRPARLGRGPSQSPLTQFPPFSVSSLHRRCKLRAVLRIKSAGSALHHFSTRVSNSSNVSL